MSPEVEDQPAVAAPDVTPAVPEWRASLPEEIRNSESLTKFDGAENPLVALASGYLGAEKAVGADKVVLPGQGATDEEMRSYFTAIGCPESIDGYAPPTENISEHFDTALFDNMREDAHRLGVTPQQLAGLARSFDARANMHREQTTADQVRQNEQWDADLHQKYGDAYDQNTELARGVLNAFGGEELLAIIEAAGLSSNPVVVEAFHKIGRTMAEDEILGGGGAQTFTNTPDQAQEEWRTLQLDTDFMAALQDQNHVGHKAAFEKQTQLFQQMHPEGK